MTRRVSAATPTRAKSETPSGLRRCRLRTRMRYVRAGRSRPHCRAKTKTRSLPLVLRDVLRSGDRQTVDAIDFALSSRHGVAVFDNSMRARLNVASSWRIARREAQEAVRGVANANRDVERREKTLYGAAVSPGVAIARGRICLAVQHLRVGHPLREPRAWSSSATTPRRSIA